jgi:hypothetical protein
MKVIANLKRRICRYEYTEFSGIAIQAEILWILVTFTVTNYLMVLLVLKNSDRFYGKTGGNLVGSR